LKARARWRVFENGLWIFRAVLLNRASMDRAFTLSNCGTDRALEKKTLFDSVGDSPVKKSAMASKSRFRVEAFN
jgi:hypothetical protein